MKKERTKRSTLTQNKIQINLFLKQHQKIRRQTDNERIKEMMNSNIRQS